MLYLRGENPRKLKKYFVEFSTYWKSICICISDTVNTIQERFDINFKYLYMKFNKMRKVMVKLIVTLHENSMDEKMKATV